MHVSNGIKNILYPNDYAILQALYSNEYKKHNNYEDAVKVVNEKIEELMMNTQMLTKDVGTILVGKEAVEEGLINEVGGISKAILKLHEMIDKS